MSNKIPFKINKVHCGDVLELLRLMPKSSVQTVCTSPPYWGLRDYGLPPSIWGGDSDCVHEWKGESKKIKRDRQHLKEFGERLGCLGGNKHSESSEKYEGSGGFICTKCGAWKGCLGLEPTPHLYVEHLIMIFREIRRVLRKDGVAWLNLGDSYTPQSSHKGGTHYDGLNNEKNWGPRSKALVAKKAYGKPKDLMGMPWRAAFALQADGWWLRSDIIWKKSNPMPESVKDRPTSSHEHVFMLTKSAKYFYDHVAVMELASTNSHGGGVASDTRKHRITGKGGNQGLDNAIPAGLSGRNRRDVWNISTKPFKGAHFAVFPPEIPEICIKAATSEKGCCLECGAPIKRIVKKGLTKHDGKTESEYTKGSTANRLALLRQAARELGGEYKNNDETIGWEPTCKCFKEIRNEECGVRNEGRSGIIPHSPCLVLDPFAGSGTTGVVAINLGRNFIGFDLSEKYVNEFANLRIERTILGLSEKDVEAGQLSIFDIKK